jgi:hypothetical protein
LLNEASYIVERHASSGSVSDEVGCKDHEEKVDWLEIPDATPREVLCREHAGLRQEQPQGTEKLGAFDVSDLPHCIAHEAAYGAIMTVA